MESVRFVTCSVPEFAIASPARCACRVECGGAEARTSERFWTPVDNQQHDACADLVFSPHYHALYHVFESATRRCRPFLFQDLQGYRSESLIVNTFQVVY